MKTDPSSPIVKYTPRGADLNSVFDVKAIYQDDYTDINVHKAPSLCLPEVGPYGIEDLNNVFGGGLGTDIFAERGIDTTEGVVVVVRPDQYVAAVLPMSATERLSELFDGFLVEAL